MSFARESLIRAANAAGRSLSRLRIRGIPRLMSWSGPVVVGRGPHTVDTARGVKLCIDGGDYFSCMMFYGRFGSDLLALLPAIVHRGDSVIDVGAQLGYVTTQLAELTGPLGRVHSFEPDPNALTRLRAAVLANDHSWVEIFPIAASDAEGEIPFNVSPTLGWSTAVAGTHLSNLTTIAVRAAKIDDLAAQGQIQRPVRFVKIDVEGYECSVLDGMRELIAEDRPFVVAEVNPVLLAPSGHSSVDMLRRFAGLGYGFFRLEEPKGVLSGGRVRLVPVDPEVPLDVCDVLCVPNGEPLDGSFFA